MISSALVELGSERFSGNRGSAFETRPGDVLYEDFRGGIPMITERAVSPARRSGVCKPPAA